MLYNVQRASLNCNAVFFNAEEKTCLLIKLEVNSSETTDHNHVCKSLIYPCSFYLCIMNADSVRKEKLILINYEDTLRFGNFICIIA
ncbi:hypothetical protein T4D_11793 [Trichinella pseudospiralis]|uniref:Uncharacterized protein n=1 Tax=Trichinella pseudospiralis TaxID=6337 RepID=A0A0V1FP80_TRIPS|nr:hypothetical protein T4D_11793 [Trichinella pseudospiralis]